MILDLEEFIIKPTLAQLVERRTVVGKISKSSLGRWFESGSSVGRAEDCSGFNLKAILRSLVRIRQFAIISPLAIYAPGRRTSPEISAHSFLHLLLSHRDLSNAKLRLLLSATVIFFIILMFLPPLNPLNYLPPPSPAPSHQLPHIQFYCGNLND
ncbi:hypothetical protein L2E82_32526 [Cichorium intybus]|uniref:Uncharacterized protein n=1 Tax=Cichorium intybus TaxID=13427 RepID=A0ACB9BHG7_CICIN|nr:hypothetical protein L2E82_32526 [Cichorium intybus]